jgi:N-methylhydantoinase A
LRRLIAPCAAGVASALGLLIAPARVDRVATVARDMRAIVWADLEATFARLEAEARSVLAVTLPDAGAPDVQRLADIRYVGQASELVVGLPPGPYTPASHDALLAQFEASYVAAFTRTPPATHVEIINVRVCATIAIAIAAPTAQAVKSAKTRAVKGSRMVYFPEFREFRPTIVYDRYALEPGQTLDGPAIVEERESTLLVGPGGCLKVAASGNIIVSIG